MASAIYDPPGAFRLRLAAHAASGFLLGLLGAVSQGLDLVDTVLLLSMLQANVALVSSDRRLQVRYAALQALPPDGLRRPISITALAASLGLPFETVRRRLASLEKAGLCEVSARGYRVPGRVLADARFAACPPEIDGLLRDLHRELSAAGCLDGLAAVPEPAPSFDEAPVRISARLGSDYFLRMLGLATARTGDPVDAFLLVCIFKHNGDGAPQAGACLADEQLIPVRAADVARRLALTHETARRRLLDLEGRGLCARTRNGWVVPSASLEALRFGEAMHDNLTNLRQLFSGLARMGVLDHWRREAT